MMYKFGPSYPSNTNGTRIYSPVTLSREWPTLGRLLFVVISATLGSIINGFFVAAFFVEHTLKRIGNVYHACVGMSDMIVTTAVMPTAAVVLLSGQWDILPVCQALQFLTEASTYCYTLFFTLVATESYYRFCRTSAEYEMFISMRIGLIAILVFMTGFVVAGVGTYLNLDYDYCQRLHFGNFYFRSTTSVILHAIPSIWTCYALLCTSIRIWCRARNQAHYKRSQQYERDFCTTNLNIAAYMLYVVAWMPYLIVVNEYPNTSDSKYYHCVWIGLSRSLVTSLLYSSLNRNFRRAFAHLFYYCCCKSTMTGSFSNRHRRALVYRPGAGEVRVHIMHQAVNIGSPQRAISATRETQEL